MYEKIAVRNKTGKIVGWYTTDSYGRIEARSFSGRILGYYDPKDNWTRKFSGAPIGRGNVLATLFDFS